MQLSGDTDNQGLLLVLAVSLRALGRHDEALAAFKRLTDLDPGSCIHRGNYGMALRDLGRGDEAYNAFSQARALDPAMAGPHVGLGLVMLDRHDPAAARDHLLEAVRLDPTSAEARIHAAHACNLCRDRRGEELLRDWDKWIPPNEDLQIALAYETLTVGDAPAALDILERLHQRNPANLEASVQLAGVYERVNRPDAAKALLRDLESMDSLPERVRREMQHQYATLAEREGRHEEAATILESAGPRNEFDYLHYFLLGKVRDRQKRATDAMDAFAEAHRLQVAEVRLSRPDCARDGIAPLPNASARVSEEEFRAWPRLVVPDTRQSPIFIVGFPRSGTTLLEQMLDAHPQLQSMDERPFFNLLSGDLAERANMRFPGDIGLLNQQVCDALRWRYAQLVSEKIKRRAGTQLVDKNPLNMLWLPLIHRLFPKAKFILALRHPCDVLLSCHMQNFQSAQLVDASATLERLAQAYVAAMQAWLYHVELLQPDVLVSRYEDLVSDLPRHTRRIADFLELEDATPLQRFDERAREKGYIATPSYTQVIRPATKSAMNRWQAYRAFFEPVLPTLRPMLEHWGYSAENPDNSGT